MDRRRRGEAVLGVPPWYERNHRLAAGVIVVLYGLVLVARYFGGSGPHAVSVLYVFPVSLMALMCGLRGGLVGSAIAVTGMVIPEVFGNSHLDAIGWSTRLSAIVLLGVLLGAAQDRTRASQAARLQELAERERLEARAERVTAAAEISDTIVQGMSTAKWMMEMGSCEAGAQILAETIEQAEELVASLVERQVGEARSTPLAMDHHPAA